jgi:hypothetical protein
MQEKLKRYDPVQYYDEGNKFRDGDMKEFPDGDYVRYEDYEALLAVCVRLRDSLPKTDEELGLKSFGESMANYQSANLRQ